MTQENPVATRRERYLSLLVSELAVVIFFVAANLIMGRNGAPLGYDIQVYQEWTKEVLSSGPLAFAQNRHYVEVLYPVLSSVPASLGISLDVIEIYFPIILAIATVAATDLLSHEFRDKRVAVLTVSFAAGWFAIYRMGADFHAQLLALPFLLVATALLLRVRRTSHVVRNSGLFTVVFGLAALAHIETTAVIVAVWIITLLIFDHRSIFRRRNLLVLLAISFVIAVPMTLLAIVRFPISVPCGATCQYPRYPPYWLEVFGPEGALAILGLALCVLHAREPGTEYMVKITLVWSLFSISLGTVGYVFPSFDIAYSDRSLLMLPVPMLSALGTAWLCDRGGYSSRHPHLILALILIIPALLMPGIFVYLVPQRFRYYPP